MKISEIANIIMITVYGCSGVFLIIGINIFNFSDFQKNGLGILLIAYSLFRLYTFLKKRKEANEEDE